MMSQAFRSTKCSYLRLFHAKVRGCNTFVGAAKSLKKSHADVIQQIESKGILSGKLNGSSSIRTSQQNGSRNVSVLGKRCVYVAENMCRSLDTKLAPVSVTEYNKGVVAVWNCSQHQHPKPCIEHEDDTLQEDRNLTGISRETLRGLSGQELNRLFQIAITTARKRIEAQSKAFQNTPAKTPVPNWAVEFFDLLSVKSYSVNALLRRIFQSSEKINVTISYKNRSLVDGVSYFQRKEVGTAKQFEPNKDQGVMYYASANESTPPSEAGNPDSNKPSLDQLTQIRDYFVEHLPDVLSQQSTLHYYTQDIVVLNNYPDRPYQTNGLRAVLFQMAKLRTKLNFRYMQTVLKILSAIIDESDGSFCAHWRFYGMPFKWLDMLKPWKWVPGTTFKKSTSGEKEIFEGLATFSVDKNGMIYKIRIDKVMVDPYGAEVKKPSLVEKLAMGGNPA